MKKRTKKYKPRVVDAGAGLWAIMINKPLPSDEVDKIEEQARKSLDALRLGGATKKDLRMLVTIIECIHLLDDKHWSIVEIEKNDVIYNAFKSIESSNNRNEQGKPIGLDADGLVDIENLIVCWHDLVARVLVKDYNAAVIAANKNIANMKWACGDVVRLKEGVE